MLSALNNIVFSISGKPTFASYSIYHHNQAEMCSRECIGDQYRGCGHYVFLYETGEERDCMQSDCKLSKAHKHKTAPNCYCRNEWRQLRKVRNLFQFKCDVCKEEDEAARSAEFDRIVGRK